MASTLGFEPKKVGSKPAAPAKQRGSMNYPGFFIIENAAAIIDPDPFVRRNLKEGSEEDKALFQALQERRRVEAREKAKKIIDLIETFKR